jgi:hypothetical protein
MRGGKRPGAGRNPLPKDLRQRPLSIKIAAYLAAKFERNAKLLGLTRGEYLEALMNSRDADAG